jgi:hypothetical protein
MSKDQRIPAFRLWGVVAGAGLGAVFGIFAYFGCLMLLATISLTLRDEVPWIQDWDGTIYPSIWIVIPMNVVGCALVGARFAARADRERQRCLAPADIPLAELVEEKKGR